MANIQTVIDELSTIANAFDSLGNTPFYYDRLSHINGGDKDYPLIYVDSAVQKSQTRENNNFLPSSKTYNLNVFAFDTYHEGEKATKSLQQKQGELENIFEQYLAEVKNRLLTSDVTLTNIKGLNTIIANDVHNDRLIQVSAVCEFEVKSSCTIGTFNY